MDALFRQGSQDPPRSRGDMEQRSLSREGRSSAPASRDSDERTTPDALFRPLDALFHFTLDPCATAENTKCGFFFTKEQDGLAQSWAAQRAFVNPPFSRGQLKLWLTKALEETGNGALSVIVTGVDTSTGWMQLIWQRARLIYFPARRFAFGPFVDSAKFPIMLSVWSNRADSFEVSTVALEGLFGGRAFRLSNA